MHRSLPREGVEDTGTLLTAARRGVRLVTFPEGTLTRMSGLLEFHLGPFLVAAQAGLPVVPIAIKGTRSILRGDQWFPRRGLICVHVGNLARSEGSDFSAAVRLRDKVRSEILKFCGEPDLAHERIRIQDI